MRWLKLSFLPAGSRVSKPPPEAVGLAKPLQARRRGLHPDRGVLQAELCSTRRVRQSACWQAFTHICSSSEASSSRPTCRAVGASPSA